MRTPRSRGHRSQASADPYLASGLVVVPLEAHPLPIAEADAQHAALMRRADTLDGCQKGAGEDSELKAIVDAIEAYEVRRWPLGRDPTVPGGKG